MRGWNRDWIWGWNERQILGTAHCVALAIGFCGGLWAFDGPARVAKQALLLPFCDERSPASEPNCIVREAASASTPGKAETPVAAAAELQAPFGR